ncbi:hypothetical protein HYW43_02265 [Candidatus Daviesbacteria bacterium]|nr:hypothetical protein [Candidatus Daviesbacteria bacterium]
MNEILRKPFIGVVGGMYDDKSYAGEAIGLMIVRREAVLAFNFPPKYFASLAMDAALTARMAGGETLGIASNSDLSGEMKKRYATWVLNPSADEVDKYQALISICDAVICIGLDLRNQSKIVRKAAGRIPLVYTPTRLVVSRERALMQVVENPREAVDAVISEIMARRKGT